MADKRIAEETSFFAISRRPVASLTLRKEENMPDVHVGSVLTMDGQWRIDGKYGRQFSAQKWEETLPATTFGIEKYLGSGLIKGVGPKFAKRIVQTFGKDTLEIIETNPDSLILVAAMMITVSVTAV